MKESRFRISHFILSLSLIAFGSAMAYWFFSSWIYFDYSIILLVGCSITFLPLAVILPLYAGFGLIVDYIKKLRPGESTSMYDEKENH